MFTLGLPAVHPGLLVVQTGQLAVQGGRSAVQPRIPSTVHATDVGKLTKGGSWIHKTLHFCIFVEMQKYRVIQNYC